jgi:membrane protein required for colicin V production
MNMIDIVLGIFLLITALIGLKKGFIAAIIHLAALIIAIAIVSKASPPIAFFLITKFSLSELAAAIISYAIVFIIIGLLAKLTIYILHKVVKLLKIGIINRILGFIFGLLNGALVLIILMLIINVSPFEPEFREWAKDSVIISNLQNVIDEFAADIPVLKKQQVDEIDQLIDEHSKKIIL